jgi:transposase
MLSQDLVESVFLAAGNTDLRKSVDGLAAIVKLEFELDPFSPALFAFCNKGRNKMKILRWDINGFWLYYRRLEHGRFLWPDNGTTAVTQLTYREFRWLLDGLSPIQKQAHKPITARVIL